MLCQDGGVRQFIENNCGELIADTNAEIATIVTFY